MKIPCFKIFAFTILLAIFFPKKIIGQTFNKSNQHRFYIYWGWNHGYFSNSDIRFKGANHDFTLYDVVAKDRQSEFSFDTYFHPAKITIPQTNVGVGYFLKDHYILTLAIDHMKYVVQQNQTVKIDGTISNSNSGFDKNYSDESILIQPQFLRMEHTDGLNYVAFGISRSDNLLEKFEVFENKFELNVVEGVESGVLVPRTDVTLFNQNGRNKYHLSGWGASIKGGVHLTFFKYFILHGEIKGGYINLTDILTSSDGSNKAQQDFFFLQTTFRFGGIFYLK